MSQAPNLYGTWRVYRYNLSRHVLKAPETTLEITKPEPPQQAAVTCLARFELRGNGGKVEILMDKVETSKAETAQDLAGHETKAVTWFGEKENFDFRWDLFADGVLVGYAADRSNPGSYDTFVAVKSPQTSPAPVKEADKRASYHFERSYLTPLVRTRPSGTGGGVSIVLPGPGEAAAKVIKFDGNEYRIRKDRPYGPTGGRKLITDLTPIPGEEGLQQLVLWLLPIDGAGHPLVIGCHFHHHSSEVFFELDSVPLHPLCGKVVHSRWE